RRRSSASRTPAGGASGATRPTWSTWPTSIDPILGPLPAAPLDRCLGLAVQLLLALGLPLVELLLPLGEADLQLDPVPLEVDRQRDDGEPLELGAAEQAVDLPPAQEELAHRLRRVVLPVAVAVGADVGADQVGLLVAELDVAVLELHPPLARRLDLGAAQLDPGLEGLEDLVVVQGAPVGGQWAALALGLGGHGAAS